MKPSIYLVLHQSRPHLPVAAIKGQAVIIPVVQFLLMTTVVTVIVVMAEAGVVEVLMMAVVTLNNEVPD